ncbi:MAG: MerR family transcriptional regulator [Gemmatimonadetes bacterium]|nr:MerR family transcriptional regulator [Gemmatimonadota bacterium]
MRSWKVGELAKETGLTVRTLHHWDRVGLLKPSRRTPAGHRAYDEADVARLQQVMSLRQLGLSLDEARECLARPDFSPLATVRMHLDRLREKMEMQRRLAARLEAVAESLRLSETVSVEDFLRTIEAISMFERYFTPEQMEQVRRRGAEVGQERIRQVEAEWPALIAEVRAAVERGDDPAGEPARALARRWAGLVEEFTGGDPGISRSVSAMYSQEPAARDRYGISTEMFRFITMAREAGGPGA